VGGLQEKTTAATKATNVLSTFATCSAWGAVRLRPSSWRRAPLDPKEGVRIDATSVQMGLTRGGSDDV
jgi:hypothetical protein